MEITDAFLPSLIVSESHFHFYRQKGVIADALCRVAEEGFYKGAEIADIMDKSERKRIGEVVVGSGLCVAQWMSLVLINEGLNLSSINEDLRRKSVSRMKDHLEPAAECRASYFALLSGPDPGAELRNQATEQLYRSLCELCEAAENYSICIFLEPLDRPAHKKGLIGPGCEAADLVGRVRKSFNNMSLCWDSAHLALNGEDILESLVLMKLYITRLHLSNPVLDSSREDFGDNHIPIGPPGDFTIEDMVKVFRKAVEIELFVKQKPYVSVEVRSGCGADPWDTVVLARRTLQQVWNLYKNPKA